MKILFNKEMCFCHSNSCNKQVCRIFSKNGRNFLTNWPESPVRTWQHWPAVWYPELDYWDSIFGFLSGVQHTAKL